MPEILFIPINKLVTVAENVKILAAAIKNKVEIRYGCGACQCGTCGIEIVGEQKGLLPMEEDEKALLKRMELKTDGSQRLACRAKVVSGQTVVDLSFQESYSPDQGLDEEEEED